MEINSSPASSQQSHQFAELVLSLIRLRPHLLLPEHIQRFRRQMEVFRNGSPEEYQFIIRIFIVLVRRSTPPTMGELSTELDIPFSTATRIVDWLVDGDFVERLPDPDDRRVIRVRLTPTGRRYYDLSMGYIRQHVEKLLQDFTPAEQADLYHLISKLLVALEQEKYPPVS